MPIEILMPALSPTMEEGTLAKWLVKEGDAVASGDLLAEIETDKATMEFEAVDEGIIGKLLVAEGTENVAVNSAIERFITEGKLLPDCRFTGRWRILFRGRSSAQRACKPCPGPRSSHIKPNKVRNARLLPRIGTPRRSR